MWVPLIENDEYQSPGADYFVEQHIRRLFAADPDIDTLLLACTHYPLLMDKIRQFVPPHVQVIAQGDIVAESLAYYLQRHPEIENRLTCGTSEAQVRFYTTDTAESFEAGGAAFFRGEVKAIHTDLKPVSYTHLTLPTNREV